MIIIIIGLSIQDEFDTTEFRRAIYDNIAGSCLTKFDPRSKDTCKVFIEILL